jgi:hypothetical protein
MIKKVINCNAAVVAVVLLNSFPLYSRSLGPDPDQKASQKTLRNKLSARKRRMSGPAKNKSKSSRH